MRKFFKILLYVLGGFFIAGMLISCGMRISYGLSPEWGTNIFGVVIGVVLIIGGRMIQPKAEE